MDLPIEIFLSFIGLSVVMGIVGLWKKIPLLMFIAGAMITFWAITTDNIIQNSEATNAVKTIIPTVKTHMAVNTGTTVVNLRNGSNTFVGEEVATQTSTLFMKDIDEITMSFSRTGSPTGTAIIGVWDSSAVPSSTNFKYRLGSINVATIDTLQTSYVFKNITNNHILLDNQAVGVFYNGGSAGNQVNVFSLSPSTFDDVNSQRTAYSTVWADTSTQDIRMNIRLNGVEETIVNDFEDNPYPFTEYPKILFGIFGAVFMLAGALIWKYEEE